MQKRNRGLQSNTMPILRSPRVLMSESVKSKVDPKVYDKLVNKYFNLRNLQVKIKTKFKLLSVEELQNSLSSRVELNKEFNNFRLEIERENKEFSFTEKSLIKDIEKL